MSEPIPESIPTSHDRRSHRPLKRAKPTPTSLHSAAIHQLMSKPDMAISLAPAPAAKNLPAPPEIVANVQGSSAGAGSGEFHVYKASRRREMERVRAMDEEGKREESEKAWKEKVEEMKKLDEVKTKKNQEKRRKKKEKKAKGKDGATEVEEGEGSKRAKVEIGAGRPRLDDLAEDRGDGERIVEERGIVIHDDD